MRERGGGGKGGGGGGGGGLRGGKGRDLPPVHPSLEPVFSPLSDPTAVLTRLFSGDLYLNNSSSNQLGVTSYQYYWRSCLP